MALSTMARDKCAPLYIKNKDIINGSSERVTAYEICKSIANVIPERHIEGAQLIRGVWKVYISTLECQMKLLCQGVPIRNILVHLQETNPYIRSDDTSVRVLIKDLPLYMDSQVIKNYLEESEGLILKSEIKFSNIKDKDGNWTNFKNGDRFVYVAPIIGKSLPREARIGEHPCRIFHNGQEEQCRVCDTSGHKTLSDECPAIGNNEDHVVPFRGYKHILSNFAPCQIKHKGKIFTSSEAVYMSEKAEELDMPGIAEKIRRAPNATKANLIAREELEGKETNEWIGKTDEVMRMVLRLKAKYCPEFCNALIESEGLVLAEATNNMYWATGLSVYLTMHTQIKRWPGTNKLGQLLMELREDLLEKKKTDQSEEEIVEEDSTEVEENNVEQDTEENSITDSPATEQLSPSFLYSRVKSAIFGNHVQPKIDKYVKPKSSRPKKRTPSQTPPSDKERKKLRDDIISEGVHSPFTVISEVNEHIHHPPEKSV